MMDVTQMQNLPVLPNSLAFWGLGQMGVAIKGPDATLYIDPCLSDIVREMAGERGTRAFDPPLLPGEITNADYYLISHEHADHFDPQTVGPAAQASPQAMFVTTGWCLDLFADVDIPAERVMTPPALEPVALPGTSITLTVVPSAHYEKEHDAQKGYRWIGFLIEWNGVTFYHAGDTIIYPDYIETLRRLPRPDVAMLPVNGRDHYREVEDNLIGNLLPVEASRLARDLEWDTLIPGHNDLYPANTIPNEQIVQALAPRQKVKFLQPGELYYYVKV